MSMQTSTDRLPRLVPQLRNVKGFTLLEVMVVLTILIFLAAMIYPAAGLLNEQERRKITEKKMEEIRRAIVGDPDRFDDTGERIIGGYVGDLEDWPRLYEAAPQARQHIVSPPDFDIEDTNNWSNYYYRPSGHFTGKQWLWDTPYRELNVPGNSLTRDYDHIGGLETENEGQPIGLWTDNPTGDGTGILDPDRWQGPYLIAPTDNKPENADHFATTDEQYEKLAPVFIASLSAEEWEDGDYSPTDGDPGEYFDDKEEFRLRQTRERLADGWDRALRFFITCDKDRACDPDHPCDPSYPCPDDSPNGTIFWILSEGQDGEGTYPTKGTFNGSNWTVDADDIMALEYDPDDQYNQDNIVMKIHSYEWEGYFAKVNQRKQESTEEFFRSIRRALVGDTTSGENGNNSGYTGAMCRWPLLFQWEDNGTANDTSDDYWDDLDDSSDTYTKGQPRGLWTDQPNSSDTADNLTAVTLDTPSIGWSGSYLVPPIGELEDNLLLDAWGQEVLFFLDDGADDTLHTTDDVLMILSRGPDRMFDFLDTDTLPEASPDGTNDYYNPASFTEAVDVSIYDPNDSGGYNADNIMMYVHGTDWQPGWLQLDQFTVLNATVGTTKAMFVYGWDSSSSAPLSLILTATTLTDEDGDAASDDWAQGAAGIPALDFNDISTDTALTGTRALVFWNDDNGNDEVDTGEKYQIIHYNILDDGGLDPRTNPEVNTNIFTTAP